MAPLCFAYYCSGHGYGHATRTSAFACHLRSLELSERPTIYIVSSAPEHVFADSIAQGALYRNADIDPVIVQPLAYRVDRQKSIDGLKSFLRFKDQKLEQEGRWLLKIEADCVLSDAAFLGCLAANVVGIPSILITNFTFDSVYSYLSTDRLDVSSSLELNPDIPIPLAITNPLVEQMHAGYRCADLLLRLPGCIPIPSFSVTPSLPSPAWVDPKTNHFYPKIISCLDQPPSLYTLYPPLPSPNPSSDQHSCRAVRDAPLLVRTPTPSAQVYSVAGRARFLSSLGIPADRHDPATTKILIVSFGGQAFLRPSRSASLTPSRPSTPNINGKDTRPKLNRSPNTWQSGPIINSSILRHPEKALKVPYAVSRLSIIDDGITTAEASYRATLVIRADSRLGDSNPSPKILTPSPSPRATPMLLPEFDLNLDIPRRPVLRRLATPCHIWVPGAPPALKPRASPPTSPSELPTMRTLSLLSSEVQEDEKSQLESDLDDIVELLPDPSWIAIVCGVSKEQWNDYEDGSNSELPEGFYVAPKYIYMPDLTAVADVLLGKLGYGTVAECVDSCTPFVYVSRPLFIEEHGLRLLLDREGVGLELSRQNYEAGQWASAVSEAWSKGKAAKANKRKEGIDAKPDKRIEEGREMAKTTVAWVKEWWAHRTTDEVAPSLRS